MRRMPSAPPNSPASKPRCRAATPGRTRTLRRGPVVLGEDERGEIDLLGELDEPVEGGPPRVERRRPGLDVGDVLEPARDRLEQFRLLARRPEEDARLVHAQCMMTNSGDASAVRSRCSRGFPVNLIVGRGGVRSATTSPAHASRRAMRIASWAGCTAGPVAGAGHAPVVAIDDGARRAPSLSSVAQASARSKAARSVGPPCVARTSSTGSSSRGRSLSRICSGGTPRSAIAPGSPSRP